ncbi:MAG: hypothetical protein AB4042_10755 [Leptolyngbyaceae cyanobacterium]
MSWNVTAMAMAHLSSEKDGGMGAIALFSNVVRPPKSKIENPEWCVGVAFL